MGWFEILVIISLCIIMLMIKAALTTLENINGNTRVAMVLLQDISKILGRRE